MKETLLRLLPCLAVAAFLTGCLNSESPLGPSSKGQIDPALLGSWQAAADGSRIDVHQFDETQYVLVDDGPKSGEEPSNPVRAFSTRLLGWRFLNLKPLGGKYFFFALYNVNGDSLRVWRLSGGRQHSAGELRRYVISNLRNRSMFGKPELYSRLAQAPLPRPY